MALVKSVSDIKKINSPIERVYEFLSDFKKIETVFTQASERMSETEKAKLSEQIDNFSATCDTCTFNIKGFGKTGIEIIEKDPCKTIKYKADGSSPFPITLWIQLLSKDTDDTRIRVTLHAEVNMMMKMMLKKKLDKGINQIADALVRFPY